MGVFTNQLVAFNHENSHKNARTLPAAQIHNRGSRQMLETQLVRTADPSIGMAR